MYPEELCTPMREDLTSVGFIEMKDSNKVSEILDKDKNELLILGIGNPFYAHAHHIGYEDRKVMGGLVSSAQIEIAIPTNINAKYIAISSRDSMMNLNDIQWVELP